MDEETETLIASRVWCLEGMLPTRQFRNPLPAGKYKIAEYSGGW
jgi:hypothetical protein